MAIEHLHQSHQELLRRGALARAEAERFARFADQLLAMIHELYPDQPDAGRTGEALHRADAPREADDVGRHSSPSRLAAPAASSVSPPPPEGDGGGFPGFQESTGRPVSSAGSPAGRPPMMLNGRPAAAMAVEDEPRDWRFGVAEKIIAQIRKQGRHTRVERMALDIGEHERIVREVCQAGKYGVRIGTGGYVRICQKGGK